jgi:DNA helicase HerA-like ATPase
MTTAQGVLVGKGESPQHLLYAMANRHGLIAGATGTGKTVSVRVLAEGLARSGVAVVLADVKGDLSGIGQPGTADPRLAARATATGVEDFAPAACPVVYWDIFGKKGHPIRTTISEMGPFLLARLLSLTPAQEGALNIAFKIADEEGLLLLDLKDLRAILEHIAAHAAELTARYGNVGKSSVGAIQRQLLALEQEGGEALFGEPALDIRDLLETDGRGTVHLLAADDLIHRPRLYATFLLALLSEIYEELPEAGDLDRPKLVFFFDEAHLLFDDAPKALVDKIEQVVRLIRSKGVGVYFISQSPLDIPDSVLGQLGNRIQHALRAFTPRDQKAVRAAAETFRANPGLDVTTAITELAVGEALVSMLDENGVPSPVERTLIRPPASRLGPATPAEIGQAIAEGPLAGKYEELIDRSSAYEHLKQRAEGARQVEPDDRPARTGRRPAQARETPLEALAKSAARSIGSTLGRQIVRGVLGAILRGR